jgi:hypothetical protein
MMACAPIVATGVMKGIEVGAVAGAKGEPLITFKLDSKLTPQRAAYALHYFLTRTNKLANHFDRMAVSYAPVPQQNSLVVGKTSDYAMEGGGGTCTFYDDGVYDCSGGYSGYDGGYEGPISDPAPPANDPVGQCESNCGYPPSNDNGDGDPCTAPDGSRICNSPADIPSVPVNGQRPAEEQMGCRPAGPFLECGIPPVVGGFPDFPQQSTPWFAQSTCNQIPWLCSTGQYPDNDRGEGSEVAGKTMDQLYDICFRVYETEMDVCSANRAGGTYRVCEAKAANRLAACQTTARDVTDNGAHVAP